MKHADVLKKLYPPVSYDINGEQFVAQCETDGACFDLVQSSANQVLDVISPTTAGQMLADWERVLGLNAEGKSYQQRVLAAVAKINETGGLSIPYFTELAQAAGYQIKIVESQPFRAGVNRCGDALELEDVIYSWRVQVAGSSQQVVLFRAGLSTAGDKLSSYSDSLIEAVFEDLKPAHTYVSFEYGA